MLPGVSRLKKILGVFFVSILLATGLVSCSGSSSSAGMGQSGLKFRAFVSNPLHPGLSGGGFPVVEIVDAIKDVLSPNPIQLSAEPDAGFMVMGPKKDRTLLFSPSNNGLVIINNSQESVAATTTLPGPTESMIVWIDGTTAFIAVPAATVAGHPPGLVGSLNTTNVSLNASIPVAGAHYLVPSPNGNQILIISDSTDSVTVLAPALISGGNPLTPISGAFDKPVWAVFSSDGSKAYVMNCGQPCGGVSTPTVAVVDMTTTPPTLSPTTIPVTAATFGLLQGSNLYVAGTPPVPQNDCAGVTPPTASTSCGRLTVINTTSLTATSTVPITDGYHNRMQLGANGQLFIGAHNCTNINISGGEVRGCLSIFDTNLGKVVAPPENGDVTGIEPVPNRHVVYVCQAGALRIYDTTTDQLQATQVSIVGQAIDVKIADF